MVFHSGVKLFFGSEPVCSGTGKEPSRGLVVPYKRMPPDFYFVILGVTYKLISVGPPVGPVLRGRHEGIRLHFIFRYQHVKMREQVILIIAWGKRYV